jgi:nitrous oxidase accessory protein NosD
MGILFISAANAVAPIHDGIQIQQSPKQYAKANLTNHQYKCALELYTKESNWRPNAKNGSHYGIPQGRSIYLKTANPVAQVKWGIAYSNSRYGSMCKALDAFKRKGWH